MTPSPRAAWAAALLLSVLAPAHAADLLVDGQGAVMKPIGSDLIVSITGTPGDAALLLLDLDGGPTDIFGQTLPLGFSPALSFELVGTFPPGGTLDVALTTPFDPGLADVVVYVLAASVPAGAFPSDFDWSPGASVTIVDRDVDLAGRPLPGAPSFEFVRAFNEGDPISVAVDTTRWPGMDGQAADVYLVEAKAPFQWAADPTLVDVSSDGVETVTFAGPSIQANTVQVDPGSLSGFAGPSIGVPFDVVLDLDQDGVLDDDDLIDGLDGEAGLYVCRDLTLPGPYAVTEALYSGGTWLDQNLFYPTNIASLGELPLVVVSHGNGHNYQWYDHIGEHLAGYGFVVMSHSNNTQPGPFAASTTTLDNTDWFLGNLDLIEGGLLDGHVDGSRITWIGHSRGGEGVVRAYDRIFDGIYTPINFTIDDIVLVSSIAPTDFLGTDKSFPHGVDYHLWVGGADADVTGCASSDIAQPIHLHDRAEQKRMSISLHGVGHGDFHNGPGSVAVGPCLVGKADTHTIMRAYLLPLVMHHVEGNVPAEDYLWRQWEGFHSLGTPDADPCVVVDLQYREGDAAGKVVIDDFQSNPATGVSSSGGQVIATVQGLAEGRLDDPDSNFTDSAAELFNGFTQAAATDSSAGAVFEWDGSRPMSLRWELPAAARNGRDFDFLSVRAAQVTRDGFTVAELADLVLTVELTDGSGTSASLRIDAWGGGIEEPYQRSGCGIGLPGWANEFETIRIRLTDFLHDGTGLDLTDLAELALHVGPGAGSTVGRLGLDDIEFTRD